MDRHHREGPQYSLIQHPPFAQTPYDSNAPKVQPSVSPAQSSVEYYHSGALSTLHSSPQQQTSPSSQPSYKKSSRSDDQDHTQPLISSVQPYKGSHDGSEPSASDSSAKHEHVQSGTPQPSHAIQHKRNLLYEWRWEMLCWIFGSLTFAASIVLLTVFHNALLSNWKSKIQITTIVAALAQASTSSFLVPISSGIAQLKWTWFQRTRRLFDLETFDQASRGPQGSLGLIFRLGSPKLVTIGAFATILLLAFPTFIQQSVNVELRHMSHTTNDAYIESAKAYGMSFFGQSKVSPELFTIFPDLQMATAISSGMLDPQPYRSLSNITANCPNDRCTWEPYTSIGICYTTEDITSTIVELKSANSTATVLATTEIAGTGYNISANNWLYVIFKSIAFYWDGSFLPTDHIPPPNKTDSNIPNLADILLLYFDPCLAEHGEAEAYKAYKAFRATMSLCLQSLDTTFNISTATTLLSSITALDWTLVTGLDANELNVTRYCTGYNGETFCIDRLNLIVMGGQIAMAFNQFRKLGNNSEPDTSVTIGGIYLMQDIMGTNPTNCSNETGLGFEGFERRIRNVAISMTNAMRSSNTSNIVTGTTYTIEQYISVNYFWLSYPIALFLFLTTFFFATIYATRHGPLWKSSPLALLFAMNPDNTLSSTEQMERKAKNMGVIFKERKETWMLVPEGSDGKEIVRAW